jgi:hypothetical protein
MEPIHTLERAYLAQKLMRHVGVIGTASLIRAHSMCKANELWLWVRGKGEKNSPYSSGKSSRDFCNVPARKEQRFVGFGMMNDLGSCDQANSRLTSMPNPWFKLWYPRLQGEEKHAKTLLLPQNGLME